MTATEKIKLFLSELDATQIYFDELNFYQAEFLEDEQIGYSIDPHGNSLVNGEKGDWKDEWIAIGNDFLGDPYIVDTSSNNLRVLNSTHGVGDWDPFVVADSFDKFREIIFNLYSYARDKSGPVAYMSDLITNSQKQEILKNIEQHNPGAEIWYWKNFFECD